MRCRIVLVVLAIVCSFGFESRGQTPASAVRYHEAGERKLKQADWVGAVEDFTKAIELNARLNGAKWQKKKLSGDHAFTNPDSESNEIAVSDAFTAHAYTNRAIARFYLEDFDAAITDFERAVRIKPKLAEAYSGRAAARQAKGDHDGALLDFERALSINKKLVGAHNNRGFLFLEKKDFAAAIEDFNRAIELQPTLVSAHQGRGTCFMKQGQFDLAVRDFTQTIELDPGIAEAYANRGLALIVLGKEREALTDFEKCLELDPKLKNTLEARIQVARDLRRTSKARLQ